jgi:hypothetical protein
MSELATTIFRLSSRRLTIAPNVSFQYHESDTGVEWHISAGGSRAYFLRAGVASVEGDAIGKQNEHSYFMASRLLSALLLGGHGLFQAEAVGRIFFAGLEGEPSWHTQLNFSATDPPVASPDLYDWIGAFSRHPILRRAANDAHAALSNPAEAGMFVYRGLEWLLVGEGRSWNDLAADVGVSKKDIKGFKKLVNVDYGVRHASKSGQKLKADVLNHGTWVAGLIDAINATRGRLEKGYAAAEPGVVAAAVMAAMPVEPFS